MQQSSISFSETVSSMGPTCIRLVAMGIRRTVGSRCRPPLRSALADNWSADAVSISAVGLEPLINTIAESGCPYKWFSENSSIIVGCDSGSNLNTRVCSGSNLNTFIQIFIKPWVKNNKFYIIPSNVLKWLRKLGQSTYTNWYWTAPKSFACPPNPQHPVRHSAPIRPIASPVRHCTSWLGTNTGRQSDRSWCTRGSGCRNRSAAHGRALGRPVRCWQIARAGRPA